MIKNIWLVCGAMASFLVAALHIYIIIAGAPGYRYFGAGEEFAQAAETGKYFPAIVTSGIVIMFVVFGVFALAGAGVIQELPLMRYIILLVGIGYTLRGFVLFVELAASLNIFAWREGVRPQDPIFSAVSLLFGVVHLLGWWTLRGANIR